uniref:Uncharacterized protein n=1 Tax=viral metagenome TaxID=1070528 RepID=A0A6C0LZK3_9ZZZZ
MSSHNLTFGNLMIAAAALVVVLAWNSSFNALFEYIHQRFGDGSTANNVILRFVYAFIATIVVTTAAYFLLR